MLHLLRDAGLPDPAVARARLRALAGLAPPGPEPAGSPAAGDGGDRPAPEGAGQGARAAAGRALLVVALLAVGAAAWLTWRAQGGDLVATLVDPATAASPGPAPGTPGAPSPRPSTVVVQVVGVVRRPGVVRLPAGARVVDAVAAAGGLRPGRSSGLLNLARPVVDGEQIVVGGSGSAAPPGAASPAAAGLVDLNSADVAALDTLPGVGPVTAAAILGWRSQHGRFTSVDQLREVDGIGPKTFERLAPLVSVGPGP